jgi:hypothetical protein
MRCVAFFYFLLEYNSGMPRKSKANMRRSWKMERASVRQKGSARARSNKFSGGDTGGAPKKHARKKVWVGGYVRLDGTKVKEYYRGNAQYKKGK